MGACWCSFLLGKWARVFLWGPSLQSFLHRVLGSGYPWYFSILWALVYGSGPAVLVAGVFQASVRQFPPPLPQALLWQKAAVLCPSCGGTARPKWGQLFYWCYWCFYGQGRQGVDVAVSDMCAGWSAQCCSQLLSSLCLTPASKSLTVLWESGFSLWISCGQDASWAGIEELLGGARKAGDGDTMESGKEWEGVPRRRVPSNCWRTVNNNMESLSEGQALS